MEEFKIGELNFRTRAPCGIKSMLYCFHDCYNEGCIYRKKLQEKFKEYKEKGV